MAPMSSQSAAVLTYSRAAPPNPPGYLPPASAKDLSKVCAICIMLRVFVLRLAQTGPVAASEAEVARRARQSTELRIRRAWELALSPAKSLPMQAVMLYFSGSGIQIFSLGMIFMLLTSPITAVLNIFNGASNLPLPVSGHPVSRLMKLVGMGG